MKCIYYKGDPFDDALLPHVYDKVHGGSNIFIHSVCPADVLSFGGKDT